MLQIKPKSSSNSPQGLPEVNKPLFWISTIVLTFGFFLFPPASVALKAVILIFLGYSMGSAAFALLKTYRIFYGYGGMNDNVNGDELQNVVTKAVTQLLFKNFEVYLGISFFVQFILSLIQALGLVYYFGSPWLGMLWVVTVGAEHYVKMLISRMKLPEGVDVKEIRADDKDG